MNLRLLLFIALSVVMLIPVIFFGIWPHSRAFDKEIADVSERHLLLARNIGAALERYDRDVKSTFRLLATNVVEGNSLSGTKKLLSNLNFRHICVASMNDNKVLFSLNEDISPCPERVPAERYKIFQQLASPDEVRFTKLLRGPHGKPTLYIVWVIGKYLAVGAVDTDYIVGLGKAISFGKRGHAAIVDHAGQAIAHPLAKWRQEMKDMTFLPPVKLILEKKTGVSMFYTPAMKADMIAGYTWVPGSDWGVMIPQPVPELRARADAVQRYALGVIIAGVIASALVSWILSGYLTGPVRAVVATARNMTAGDRSARVPDLKGIVPQEFKELSQAFNTMATSVEGSYKQQTAVAEAISSAEGEGLFDQLAESLAEILAADYVFIGELFEQGDEQWVSTIAFHADGARSENFKFTLKGTPCENVVGKKTCVHETGVQKEFPDNQSLKDMDVDCYFGTPLFGPQKKALGLMAVMSRRPMENSKTTVDLLNIFGIRVAAGLQRLRAEEKIKNALAEAEHANQTKSAFLATMSHELRTPLNAIIGFSQIISEQVYGEIQDKRYRDYAEDINNSGLHLLALINDLLDMTKIESGKLIPDETNFPVADEIMNNFKLVEGMALKKNISLALDLGNQSLNLRADVRMFQQILTNLLSNAVKFTPVGGTVAVSGRIGPAGGLMLEVVDTGIGIPSTDIKSVLEPFEQAHNNKSKMHGGTGLGLPIARSLMEAHDGTLEIASEVGKGTKVTITFPAARILATA
ncbi:MAG: HAMP domain-containing protein [Rhodospirillales bacterium]|nr:HAMP domain-containing protein [Rhodospirillales bacterium]